MTTFPEHPEREQPDNDCPSCEELSSRIEELEAENHRLREALEQYGQHQPQCKSMMTLSAEDCTCGWTATDRELI